MRYRVFGADRDSGEDRSLDVEASDEGEAEARAGMNGLIVAEVVKIHRSNTMRDIAAAAQMSDASRVPEYKEIVHGAWWINVLGTIFEVIGAMEFLGGAGLMAFSFVSRNGQSARETDAFALIGFVYGLGVVFVGLSTFAVGAVLHMLAGLAMAHRDLVRHSLR